MSNTQAVSSAAISHPGAATPKDGLSRLHSCLCLAQPQINLDVATGAVLWWAGLLRGGNLFRCGEVTKSSGWESIQGRELKLSLYLFTP